MSSELPYGGPDLARIHAKSNLRKANHYFTGFLSGILSSRKVEDFEIDPLKAECFSFARLFGDEDAVEILTDLDTAFANYHGEIHDILECIVDQRSADFLIEDDKDCVNRFYGFLAGIACDGRILVSEIQEIFRFVDSYPNLVTDQRVGDVLSACRMAVSDGVISPEEEQDICGWISRVVGDSYSDTGLASWGAPPVLEGAIADHTEVVFEGRLFVLTGAFMMGPRKSIEGNLVSLGAQVAKSVSRKTDYLVIAHEASRDWRQSHAGTKILKAYDIRNKHGRPDIMQEQTLKLGIDALTRR